MKGNSTLKVTKFFFDAPKILASVDMVAVQVLSRFGAFVRRTAKTSIRQSKRVSAPGELPRSHTGLLKKFIFFAYDPATTSVVIGPEKLSAKAGFTPKILEFGGANATAIPRRSGRKLHDKKIIHVAARPYMLPALTKELPGLPEMWKNSVKS